MTECPYCEGENTEWVNIIGHPPQPKGSEYRCDDCNRNFTDKELNEGPSCEGCGWPVGEETSYCWECSQGRV